MGANRLTLLAVLAFALTGCLLRNPYANYYFDNLGGQRVDQVPNLAPATIAPIVYQGGNVQQDNQKMEGAGFTQIGYSSFNDQGTTPQQSLDDARTFGKSKQAEVVLIYSQFTGTITEQIPYTAITGGETTTWDHPRPDGTVRESSQTTQTYETQLQQVQTDRYDFTATFWVRKKALVDEPLSRVARPGNALLTVSFPPSFVAKPQPNFLELSRSLPGGIDEALIFTAVERPISSDYREFARVVETAAQQKLPHFALQSSGESTCLGSPAIVTRGTFVPGNGATYQSWTCEFVSNGHGYRFWYGVPQSLAAEHAPMLKRIVDGIAFGGTSASADDEALTQQYATADGKITAHYPASFAANPQPPAEVVVSRPTGETAAFRTMVIPGGGGLVELAAAARADQAQKAATAKLTLHQDDDRAGICNGSPAVIQTATAQTAKATVKVWRCAFIRGGVGYVFGYVLPDALAAREPLMKRMLDAATTAGP